METHVERCGEVFLTALGDFVLHCTICETKFIEFPVYANHVQEKHTIFKYEEDRLEDFENDDASDTVTSLVSKEDIIALDQLEFLAPEPECNEIEDFVKGCKDLNSKSDQTKLVDSPNKRLVRKKAAKESKTSPTGIVYTCPYCDATSHSRKSMNDHKQRHKGILRHKCDICTKAFFSTSELKVHMRSHTGERPYLCSDCGQKFITTSALRTHIESCRDIRNAQCQICKKMFRNEMYLRRHMTAHSSERAFSCSMCDAKFKQKKALQSHVKIHENRHGYKCELCPASFNQRPGLYSHLKSKHKYVIKARSGKFSNTNTF